MEWIEAILPLCGDSIDLTCERLLNLGIDGMVVEDENDFRQFMENNAQYWDFVDPALEASLRNVSRIKFYLKPGLESQKLLECVGLEFGRTPQISLIRELDWENNWREHYKPIEVGERFIIVPEWETVNSPRKMILRLDPGLSFGTGSHPTTKMCICALEKHICEGLRVLDIGCGSGILAIAALKLGASELVGCDVDPKAADTAIKNAALNGYDGGQFRTIAGDILSDLELREEIGAEYDLAVANIVADVIIPLSSLVCKLLKPGGVFICSGIIEGRQKETKMALIEAGFNLLSDKSLEDWHCLTSILT